MLKIIPIIVAVLFLSACSGRSIDITTSPLDRLELNLPKQNPVNLRPVNFIIITPENAEEVFESIRQSREEIVLFGLTGLNYKNLALNVDAIKQHLKIQNKIIEIYRDYYENLPKSTR